MLIWKFLLTFGFSTVSACMLNTSDNPHYIFQKPVFQISTSVRNSASSSTVVACRPGDFEPSGLPIVPPNVDFVRSYFGQPPQFFLSWRHTYLSKSLKLSSNFREPSSVNFVLLHFVFPLSFCCLLQLPLKFTCNLATRLETKTGFVVISLQLMESL